MTAPNSTVPLDPDELSHATLLASDPVDWAQRAPVLVYERHAAPLASRADRRARRLESVGDRASEETARRNAVNQLGHTCTNYEELVADVAAHYGHGRRDDVITLLRDRALRALAHRFPPLAAARRAVAEEHEPPPHRQPNDASVRQDRQAASD